MIPPSFARVDERSPFPVKRRVVKRAEAEEEPAITILPPEPMMTAEFFRSSSPGVYKTAPTKSAKSKAPSSFVILGEMLTTPVQSRPASPSGRVSPFRGKGFKSPAVSRAPSPDPTKPKKEGTKPATVKKPVPRYKTDIGLPPKSPKKIKPRPVKNPIVQKTNLGVDKTKPNRTPRPVRKPLTVAKNKKNANDNKPPGAVTEEIIIGEQPKQTNMTEVSEALNNWVDDMDAAEKAKKESTKSEPDEPQLSDPEKVEEVNVKEIDEDPKVEPTANKEENGVEEVKTEPEVKEKEKLIPCFQPDKCHIAPPTMASPSPIITSAINAPSITSGTALTKTTESIETAQASAVPTTSLTAISSAVTISGNLARKSQLQRNTTLSPKPESTVKEEAEPTEDQEKPTQVPSAMPPHSLLPVTDIKKESEQKEDVLSTTNLIQVDSELELLSANNLRESPPRRQPNPAWNEERLVNGVVPSAAENRSKFRRFLSSMWRFLKFIFCCRCFLDYCRRAKCCKCNSKCCRSENGEKGSCCKRLNPFQRCGGCKCCRCKKPKCCEGSRCCRSKSKPPLPSKRKCCAKPKCRCKDCCANLKNRCSDLGGRVNSICRSLFCLNTMCCQGWLRRSCRSCHKWKCCQAGGCCTCFNPNVKRPPKLDKRASTQSKTDNENLDPVLVEHVSLMKAAIPVLPTCLAVLCLILNLVFPGSGTFLSGILCLCFGKPRFSVKDSAKNRAGSFCVNFIIGIAQLFTIVFCLVGWGWSIWWGVIMYRLARKQRRIKLAEKSTQEANNAANHNHVDVEKG